MDQHDRRWEDDDPNERQDEVDARAEDEQRMGATTATADPEAGADAEPDEAAREREADRGRMDTEETDGGAIPMGTGTATATGTANGGPVERDVLTDSDREGFQRRWESVMAGFIDDPRSTTEQADAVVGELLDRLNRRREELRGELRGDGTDTERMRLVLRQYRVLYQAVVGG